MIKPYFGLLTILLAFALPLLALPLEETDVSPIIITREKRDANGNIANCDFKVSPTIGMCGWSNLNLSAFSWLPSSGQDAHWIGGPKMDQTDKNKMGGYAFFETSQLPNAPEAANTVSAMLKSPTLQSTGSKGHCVSFSYAMDGLSAYKLRVLLHPIKEKKEVEPSKENSDKEEMKFDLQKAKEVMEQDFRDNMVLATLQDGTRGKWKTAQVMYSFALPHKIILEAIPKDETDQARRYRGYIAVDDLYFESGDSCQGHCTFDSGMCGFLNAKGQDHFDWEVVRTF